MDMSFWATTWPNIFTRKPSNTFVGCTVTMVTLFYGSVFQIYQFDCYFRQMWTDSRLAFLKPYNYNKTLSVSIQTLSLIWKPDTYFYNGRKSYIHDITTPNKLLRIEPNGRILYSMR